MFIAVAAAAAAAGSEKLRWEALHSMYRVLRSSDHEKKRRYDSKPREDETRRRRLKVANNNMATLYTEHAFHSSFLRIPDTSKIFYKKKMPSPGFPPNHTVESA